MRKQLLRGLPDKMILLLALLFSGISVVAQEWQVSTLHSFGNPDASAHGTFFGVIFGSDAGLYGTCGAGGAGGGGIVFRLNKDGSGFESIHDFSNTTNSADGYAPAGVIQASDGRLYGTTAAGGANYTNFWGTLYSLNPDGSDFRVIYSFQSSEDFGGSEPMDLIEGADGKLYGVTRYGGDFGLGSLFQINKDGSGYQMIHEFNGDGGYPVAPLFQGSDGALYGVTDGSFDGGGPGTVFKLNTDGSGYQIVHDFATTTNDGTVLYCALTEGRDGALYGTTYSGGIGKGGVVFKVHKDGSGYRLLYDFSEKLFEPSAPYGRLYSTSEGMLCGLTEYGGPGRWGTLFALDENGKSFRVLDSFGGTPHDAQFPDGALARDAAGDFFGASQAGGLAGDGTVFRCTLKGGHSILHSFNSSGGDGAYPNSALSSITVGPEAFQISYGTTAKGGVFGQGTAFQMNYDGSGYKILRSFSDQPIGMVPDQASSNFYVTTLGPGAAGQGALYRMKPNGALKLLHAFRGPPTDGANPGVPFSGAGGGAFESPDGMLYGVTLAGGKADSGIIYRIGADGKDYRILHQFDGLNGVPSATLIEGDDGALYGTTAGTRPGISGTAFKINREGTGFTVLHTFNPSDPGGPNPSGPLVETSAWVLYGTTQNSPSPVIYEMRSDGSGFAIDYTFTNYSGPVTSLNCPQNGESGYLCGAAPLFQNGVVFNWPTSGGFEIIQTLGLPDVEPAVVSSVNLGVITMEGGDMNMGQIFQLLPPPIVFERTAYRRSLR